MQCCVCVTYYCNSNEYNLIKCNRLKLKEMFIRFDSILTYEQCTPNYVHEFANIHEINGETKIGKQNSYFLAFQNVSEIIFSIFLYVFFLFFLILYFIRFDSENVTDRKIGLSNCRRYTMHLLQKL